MILAWRIGSQLSGRPNCDRTKPTKTVCCSRRTWGRVMAVHQAGTTAFAKPPLSMRSSLTSGDWRELNTNVAKVQSLDWTLDLDFRRIEPWITRRGGSMSNVNVYRSKLTLIDLQPGLEVNDRLPPDNRDLVILVNQRDTISILPADLARQQITRYELELNLFTIAD